MLNLADNRNENSWASRVRRARVQKFSELFATGSGDLTVLDVGGTPTFWVRHRALVPKTVRVTLLNLEVEESPEPWISCVRGDARNLSMFRDREFDICFSNSVIEHVGGYEEQARMASEIRRVCRGYFVQTPNAYFPLEPHFLVPCWQFAPVGLRAWLLSKRRWGWMERVADRKQARAVVESIRLVNESQLRQIFPDCQIYREKIGPLTKALVAWHEMSP